MSSVVIVPKFSFMVGFGRFSGKITVLDSVVLN